MFAVAGTGFNALKRVTNDGKVRESFELLYILGQADLYGSRPAMVSMNGMK